MKELVAADWLASAKNLEQARTAAKAAEKDHAVVTALAVQVYGDAVSLQTLVGVPADASKIAVRTADSSEVERALAELTERADRSGSSRRRGRGSQAVQGGLPSPSGGSRVAAPGHAEEPQADRPGAQRTEGTALGPGTGPSGG